MRNKLNWGETFAIIVSCGVILFIWVTLAHLFGLVRIV